MRGVLSVLRRWRRIKLISVIVGLSYIGYLNYEAIDEINVAVAKSKNNSPIEYLKHDIYSNSYDNKMKWLTEKEIINRTSNCKKYFQYLPVFVKNRDIKYFEKENLDESIRLAFSHMLHNHVAIYEAFLAMYFRPYNFYCIHLDYKAYDLVRKAVEGLVKCYEYELTTGAIYLIDKKDSIEVM